jgi:hypothetical protein
MQDRRFAEADWLYLSQSRQAVLSKTRKLDAVGIGGSLKGGPFRLAPARLNDVDASGLTVAEA